MKLNEGLKEHDLEELVLPILSIDQYESKISDDAIVVAFYVKDVEPAEDLNRFIQKSSTSLLDTEVSPAPNDDGYYLVFVEIDRNDQFASTLEVILDEITNLVMIEPDSWTFTCYGHDRVFDLNEKNIHVLIRTISIEELKKQELGESLSEFFKPSILESLEIDDSIISIARGSISLGGTFQSFGPAESIDESILNEPVKLTEEANRFCRIWESVLGEGWAAQMIGSNICLSNVFDSNVLVLKSL